MKKQGKHLSAFIMAALLVAPGLALGQGSTTSQDSIPRGNKWGVDSLVMPDHRPQQGIGQQGVYQQDTGQQGAGHRNVGRMDSLPGSYGVQGSQGMQDTLRDSTRGSSATQDTTQGSSDRSREPDNTGINKRDRDDNSMTADEQGQSTQDIEVTRKIRQAIMDDDSLSTYAKNIKIITKDGMVTLRGPVRSDHEKTVIESKATSVAGASKVKNEIEVKAADPSKDN